jgi:dolichol-phosphate mannosyltransferase
VIVDLVALTAFLSVFQLAPARALAIWLAMTWNYVWNRALSFKEAQEGSWVRQYARFVLSCSAGAVVSWGSTMAILSSSWLGGSPLLASSVGILVGAGFNYCLRLFWVFRVRQKAS